LNRAYGIIAAGDVVGWGRPGLGLRQGFLYTDGGGMQGLNDLIDPAAGWFVLGAGGINASRQIAAWASGPTGQHAVRLTPSASTAPPAAPTGLAATRVGSRVQLTWNDNSTNEVGFRIDRAVGSGPFVRLAVVGSDVHRYHDSIKPGRVQRYRVRSYNAAGASAWSAIVTVS
jgi:probable HAF family extracellular repeat protein